MISVIACVDFNYGIGYKGNLLVKIPEDLQRFKELTKGSIVIMGRKTWDSLPVKPLPNRYNIVITSNPQDQGKYVNTSFIRMDDVFKLLYRHHNKIQIYDVGKEYQNADIFIIGGESVYKTLMPFADKMYLTLVYQTFEADTHFPSFGSEWALEDKSAFFTLHDSLQYRFLTYKRKNDLSLVDCFIDDSVFDNILENVPEATADDSTSSAVASIISNDKTITDTTTNNNVDHPSHYTDGKIEVIDFIEDKKLGFCLGNVVKYVARAGKKKSGSLSDDEKELEDLKKARWYLNRRIFEVENHVV